MEMKSAGKEVGKKQKVCGSCFLIMTINNNGKNRERIPGKNNYMEVYTYGT
jgi:hypothetical protein